MSHSSLREFISNVLSRKRLRFGDLRRLQRDVLPSGITSREEAEALRSTRRSGRRTRTGLGISRRW